MFDGFSRRQFVKLSGSIVAGTAAAGSVPLVNFLAANAQNSTGYKIVGYFENWSQYRQGGGQFLPAQIDPSLYTHINFAFGIFGYISKGIDPNNPHLTGDYRIQPIEWNDQTVLYPEIQKLKQKNPNLKTLLSIGGWGFNDPQDPTQIGTYTYPLFSQMAASSAGRQQFINSAIEYAHKYGFDGIDLDWEYPAVTDRGGKPEDFDNFLTLLNEFRNAINSDAAAQKLLLTIASPAIPKGESKTSQEFFQWLAQCARYLDWLNVMSYDYHGAFPDDKVTGVNAPLAEDSTPGGTFSIKNTVEAYLESGIPTSKIILGMATYGRTFKVSSPLSLSDNGPGKPYSSAGNAGPATVTPGVLSYYEIQNLISSGSLTRQWHEPTLTPYAYNSQTGDWVSYDDAESIGYKISYLIEKGLGGAMIWAIGLDQFQNGFPLIKHAKSILDNPVSRPKLPFTLISGERRYNEYSFLCSHNSFVNYDNQWTWPNQSYSISKQLNSGVRSLMLDTYFKEPGSGDVFGVIPEPGVYLLHGVDDHGWVAGITYGSIPAKRLYEALNDVIEFLKTNVSEVVTVFLEDYTETPRLKDELEKVIGLKELIYDPDNDSNWRVKEKNQWPFLSDMIKWNKRLVIFSSRSHENANTQIGVAYNRSYTKENFWSLGDLGDQWDCPSRWNDGQYVDADYPKLFVFNHYRNTPTVITAAIDNHYDKIMDRIDNQCSKTAKQLPNFVAVDFFEVPLNESKAQDVVNELNRRW
ncbi:glycoside hydrolase [Nostoc sp. LEGE 12447]|nr:glycoside hydrolase [Nostoc sp. LEGE 12447]